MFTGDKEMIDLEKMSKQHKRLFPKADLLSQKEKIKEEMDEAINAMQHFVEELADVVIVCFGLYRYDKQLAETYLTIVNDIRHNMNINVDVLEAEINRKWEINLKRKWEWNGKTYHHVEK